MKTMMRTLPLAAVLLAGCLPYTWTSSVPAERRTVAVPVFRNSSEVTELGAKVTTQILREFQREGTYSLAPLDACALEIQGEIKEAGSTTVAYERRTGARTREHRFVATAVVSFIDKVDRKVLVDRRSYEAETTYLVNDDLVTGERNASGRLAEDLARQIVDDALMLWEKRPQIADETNSTKES